MKKIILFALLMVSAVATQAQGLSKSRHDVSIGWGVGSMPMIGLAIGDLESSMGSGSINLQYMYNTSESFAVGLDVAYENAAHSDCITIMPTARLYWFQKPAVAMYSRLAAGYSSISDGKWGAQITPVAVEFGKGSIRGFVEGGFGFQGMLIGGVKFGL